jgi:transcriptional regulator with XRE-family HTH domain
MLTEHQQPKIETGTLGKALRFVMDAYGITGATLSKFSGVSRNSISSARRKGTLSTQTLERLLNALYEVNPKAYETYWQLLEQQEVFKVVNSLNPDNEVA